MRQNRSTDPWSTFLGPSERPGESAARRFPEEYLAGERERGTGDDLEDLPESCRRVLDALTAARGPLSVEALHDRLGLTLLEIADAVRVLDGRGLVVVRREGGEDLVGLAGGRD
ncbi:hypothetical protein DPM19_22110 [Actinomadura craniellae]|uniref:DprA winged helix domain-containing protein n=1 Tax=Actinomadura craniellae TaxID=2231787 RepID=A0A365H267_9ACTN|nr:helix-turn-helix domain-containing protein [Actinomadura craniellae]RAY13187.1 hypothetical protein DPM19_22110 [Actinomadura craniellae]